ncbi:MAG: ATP-binding protein, partial [Anaerolineales bacterium]
NNNGENINVRIESTPCLSEPSSTHTTIYSSITAINQSSYPNLLPNKRTESRISELTDKNEKQKQEIKYLKDTETALLKYHDQLEKAYNRQSREIEALKNQLSKEISNHKQAEKNTAMVDGDNYQASQLNSVVELAAGLAHEINQPLSAITTYSQSCLRKLHSDEDPQRIKTLIEQILVQTKRATNIIKHLRDFISKGDTHRETTNINKVIQYAINILRTEIIKHDIIIKVLQPKPVPQIMANSVQIEQVILNLIQNAVDALKKVPPPKRRLDIELSRSQTHIIITLHDTGPGVMQQNEEKIIKPFFTTKTDGMGLGLTISQAIVQDHGGQLIYKKNMAKGATFQATLAIDGRNKSNRDS